MKTHRSKRNRDTELTRAQVFALDFLCQHREPQANERGSSPTEKNDAKQMALNYVPHKRKEFQSAKGRKHKRIRSIWSSCKTSARSLFSIVES